MANVGLGITFVQRAREINQLAVQFGCIVVVAQPRNPKLRNNLDDFAFSSPSVLWLNRTNYLGFCGSMQRKPRFMQVNRNVGEPVLAIPMRHVEHRFLCFSVLASTHTSQSRGESAEKSGSVRFAIGD